ncbi:MAG: hypothetical protein XXXJIFNMEKO3_03453 [Candidatus Erwinia impunctatus]|nr:hypothetical protein XXXJIFNMEKO_03453 [Culicoides impunctatus]
MEALSFTEQTNQVSQNYEVKITEATINHISRVYPLSINYHDVTPYKKVTLKYPMKLYNSQGISYSTWEDKAY